jgi:hypothetical protein
VTVADEYAGRIGEHRRRGTELVTALAEHMADALELLGDMDRTVELDDGRKVEISLKLV